MTHLLRTLVFFLANMVLLALQAQGPWQPNTVLVHLNPDADAGAVQQAVQRTLPAGVQLTAFKQLGEASRYHQLRFAGYALPGEVALARLVATVPGVRMTELDHTMQHRAVPNDPQYTDQWNLQDIEVEAVWNNTTGGTMANGLSVALGIVDSPVSSTHPDLVDNLGVTPPLAAVDAHGTEVAGVAGAQGNNNEGIAGVNWDVDLISLSNSQFLSDVIEQFQDLLFLRTQFNESSGDAGALVVAVTASFGSEGVSCDFTLTLFNEMGDQGILVITGPPNDPVDVDVVPDWPSTCATPNNIVVTSIGPLGQVPFGFGNNTVHLLAPGIDIPTTTVGADPYATVSGNSFAIPHVAGAVALLYANDCPQFADVVLTDPAGTALTVKQAILDNVTPVSGASQITITGGKLNVSAAYDDLVAGCVGLCTDLVIEVTVPDGVAPFVVVFNGNGLVDFVEGTVLSTCVPDGCYTVNVVELSGEDLIPVPGTYTITDGEGVELDAGSHAGTFPLELGPIVLGCTNPSATNYDPAATCDDGSCCTTGITLNLFDEGNDGWEGATYTITDANSVVVQNGTLETGGEEQVTFCPPAGCYTISVTGGTDPEEIFWQISGSGQASGGANSTQLFVVGGGVVGCSDPEANNFSDNAVCSDGSCCYGTQQQVMIVSTSFPGITWTLADSTGAVVATQAGGEFQKLCLEPQCGYVLTINDDAADGNTITVNLINWVGGTNTAITGQDGEPKQQTLTLGGTNGCTDPTASNYDPNAICDDGSCCDGTAWQVVVVAAFANEPENVLYTLELPTGTVSGSVPMQFNEEFQDFDATITFCSPDGCVSGTFTTENGTVLDLGFLLVDGNFGSALEFDPSVGLAAPLGPAPPELCNGEDDDCDGLIDEDCSYPDNDADGYASDVDCNDTDPLVNPGALEICGDGIDNDCDGNEQPNTEPQLTCPPDLEVVMSPLACATQVLYDAPEFDPCHTGSITLVSGPPNGAILEPGAVTVTYNGATSAAGATDLFVADFSEPTGWTLEGEWMIGAALPGFCANDCPGNDPDEDHSPTADNAVAGMNIGGCVSTGLHAFNYLTSPAVDASGVAGTLTLEFWRHLHGDYAPFMEHRVQVFDGIGWVTIWQHVPQVCINDAVWTFQSFDVTPYKNASFQVRFGQAVSSSGAFASGGWSVDDVRIYAGNTEALTCSFTITVLENPAPGPFACGPALNVVTDAGQCTLAMENLSLTDPFFGCEKDSIQVSGPDPLPLGLSTLTLTAWFNGIAVGTCAQEVVVSDAEAPTLLCPDALQLTASATTCEATDVVLPVPTAVDNCLLADLYNDHPSGTYPLGTTLVTWTATDVAGNSSTCTQEVNVSPANPEPVITCPDDQTLLAEVGVCTALLEFTTPTMDLNCTVQELQQVQGPDNGSLLYPGTYELAFGQAGPAGTLFADDFSDNGLLWSLGPEWMIGPAAASACAEECPGNDPSSDHSDTPDNGVAGMMIGGCASTELHDFHYLTSPVINTAQVSGPLTLEFWRHLHADYPPYMEHHVQVFNGVSWVTVWAHEAEECINDLDWTMQTIDVTPFKNVAFQVRFGQAVSDNGAYASGGWSLDDVRVFTDELPSCTFQVEVLAPAWYADVDGDGLGDPNNSQNDCGQPTGYVANADDPCPLALPDLTNFNAATCGCNSGYTATTEVMNGNPVIVACEPAGPCTEDVTLVFKTDGNASVQTTWRIVDANSSSVLCENNDDLMDNAQFSASCCLPTGCFVLEVFDSAGDGLVGGGYRLMDADGKRIIDNWNIPDIGQAMVNNPFGGGDAFGTTPMLGFTNGVDVGAPYSFCLPVGADRLITVSCDKTWWKLNDVIVANENTAVSAIWDQFTNPTSPQRQQTGYEFWFFDPAGSFSYRRFRSHATTDGSGNGALRACHMRLNTAAGIPQFTKLNVKVRARVFDGTTLTVSPWGPACRFQRNDAAAQCPPTQLLNIPNNPFFSCGMTRAWATNQYVHANPVSGATQYQFRFRVQGDVIAPGVPEIVRTASTYFIPLGWTNAPALQPGVYQVDVRAFRAGQWCAPEAQYPWGVICNLNIVSAAQGGGGVNMAGEEGVSPVLAPTFTLWPNPSRGDELWLSLDGLPLETAGGEPITTVALDILTLTGQRVGAHVLPMTTPGTVYTQLDLGGQLAAGIYLVSVTAGDQVMTQRMVIAP